MRSPRFAKASSAVVLSLVWAVASALPASAHAAYKESNPADESTVSAAPSTVWAEFTEPPADGASTIEIYDPCGDRVDAGDSSASGYRVNVSMTGTKAGVYTARFKVLSTLDGHATQGEFTFTVSSGDSCVEEPDDSKPKDRPDEPVEDPDDDEEVVQPEDTEPVNEGSDQPADARNDGGRTNDGRKADARAGSKQKGDKRADDEGALAAGPGGPSDGDKAGEGLPIGGLLLAFGLVVLVGAAGGKIYAGIMGSEA